VLTLPETSILCCFCRTGKVCPSKMPEELAPANRPSTL
jgi:hypothetical protein